MFCFLFSSAKSILLALFICLFLSLCRAHSYLTRPEPYTRDQCQGCGACPREKRRQSEMDHTSSNPSVTWMRGEEVEIRWSKNNHDGGFLRLSLLPLSGTFDPAAHKSFAFYYGCWEQGIYRCEGRDCGADKSGRGFRRTITIPDVIPDGIYTFAFIWYGGIHFRRKRSQFSDFTSCAYIRIQGGKPLTPKFQPFFDAGNLGRFEHYGQCLTSSIKPGDCRMGCDYEPIWYGEPDSFQHGKKPDPLTPKSYNAEISDDQIGGEEPDKGLCRGGVCCSTSCGACLQPWCRDREGGNTACCPWYIKYKSGRKCDQVGPPCVY